MAKKCQTCDGSGWVPATDPRTGKPIRVPCPRHTG